MERLRGDSPAYRARLDLRRSRRPNAVRCLRRGGLVWTGQELATHGLVPGEFWALLSGLLGLLGGIALLLGLLTRWVAAALAIEMVVSLIFINLRAGFFATNDGAEFPLLALAALLSLMLSGAQRWAVDEQLPEWAGDVRSRQHKAHA